MGLRFRVSGPLKVECRGASPACETFGFFDEYRRGTKGFGKVFAVCANFAKVGNSRIRIFLAPSRRDAKVRKFFGFLLCAFASLREIFRLFGLRLCRVGNFVLLCLKVFVACANFLSEGLTTKNA